MRAMAENSPKSASESPLHISLVHVLSTFPPSIEVGKKCGLRNLVDRSANVDFVDNEDIY